MLSCRGVGTALFGGMLAAALVGIFLIPVHYAICYRAIDVGEAEGRKPEPAPVRPSRRRSTGRRHPWLSPRTCRRAHRHRHCRAPNRPALMPMCTQKDARKF